jgi:hypothetical protein
LSTLWTTLGTKLSGWLSTSKFRFGRWRMYKAWGFWIFHTTVWASRRMTFFYLVPL